MVGLTHARNDHVNTWTNNARLMQVLNTDYSALVAASCMNRLAKLSARFIGNRGFSIGIDDVTPAPKLVEKKQQTVSTGYSKVQDFIQEYSKGRLKLEPGCDPEQSLETVVTGVLNNIREEAAKVCVACLALGMHLAGHHEVWPCAANVVK